MGWFANTAPQDKVERTLANISADAINSNQQAVPLPYLAGRAYVTGAYISPAYNPKAVPVKTQAGKGSESQTPGYKYYADFALAFCLGGRRPVDAIYKVIVDSEIAWSGNITRGAAHKEVITVDKYGVIHLYWGDESQPIDNILLTPRTTPIGGGNPQDSTTWPANSGPNPSGGIAAGDNNPYSGHYDKHPAYRGQCYGVFKGWLLGRDRTSVPNIALELKRGCPWLGGTFKAADNLGVNPAAVLYDWLTDTRFGMALPDTQLVQPSFTALYNKLEALGARISPLITEQDDFRQAVANLLEYYDGWIRNNNGQFEVGAWSHGTIVSSGTLTDDDLMGDPELEPTGWGPTLNEFSVVYADRDHNYNTYAQSYRDPNNFRITGTPRPVVLQRPWITDATLAKTYIREYGAIHALPTSTGTLKVKREWLTNQTILPGDVFLYQSGFYQLQFYVRLLETEYASDASAVASLTVEVERSVWPSLYIPPPFQGPGGFLVGPRAIWGARITEVPYMITDHRFVTQVVALAVKGNVEVAGFRIWASLDGGSTYSCLANANDFGCFGIAAAAVAHTNAWFHVYGSNYDDIFYSRYPDEMANDTLLCFMDTEVMSIGAVLPFGTGYYQVYWYRGRLGTTETGHVVNSVAYFIPRAQLKMLDNAGFVPGAVVLFKLQPFTADADYDLASITPMSYTVSGFAPVPAPTMSPPGGPFVNAVGPVPSQAPPGFKLRWSVDGTWVNGSSLEWPKSGNTYIAGYLTYSATLRVRYTAQDGRSGPESIFQFTKVLQLPGQQQCGAPSRSFSGNRGHTGGNITLTMITAGSTGHYKKNGGVITTYSVPVHLNCTNTGDYIEYWASKAGLDDSPHIYFDNTKITVGGGGDGGPNPPILPP